VEQVGTRILSEQHCHLGEGCTYDPVTDTAWWFDIIERPLFQADLHRRLYAGRRARSHHSGAGDAAELPGVRRPAFRSAAGDHRLGGNGRASQGCRSRPRQDVHSRRRRTGTGGTAHQARSGMKSGPIAHGFMMLAEPQCVIDHPLVSVGHDGYLTMRRYVTGAKSKPRQRGD